MTDTTKHPAGELGPAAPRDLLVEAKAKLLPCPFCGRGQNAIRENGMVWSGMRYSAPVSVSVLHYCEKVAGQPSRAIERVGRDLDSAIAAWNMRS